MKDVMKFDITKASTLSEKDAAKRAAQGRAVRPRLASTIVLYRGTRDTPQILMGQRARGHDFMPSVYVFPGGRVDRADSFAPSSGDMLPRTQRLLAKYYNPARSRAIILAAIRETFEETGLCLTQKADGPIKNINHKSWDAFTPPYRPKRFDTWFMLRHVDETTLSGQMSDSVELLNLGWYDWDAIDGLKTARATDMMLQVLKDYFKYDTPPNEVFYSRWQHNKFAITYEAF